MKSKFVFFFFIFSFSFSPLLSLYLPLCFLSPSPRYTSDRIRIRPRFPGGLTHNRKLNIDTRWSISNSSRRETISFPTKKKNIETHRATRFQFSKIDPKISFGTFSRSDFDYKNKYLYILIFSSLRNTSPPLTLTYTPQLIFYVSLCYFLLLVS